MAKYFQFPATAMPFLEALARDALRSGTLEAHQNLTKFERSLSEVEVPELQIVESASESCDSKQPEGESAS